MKRLQNHYFDSQRNIHNRIDNYIIISETIEKSPYDFPDGCKRICKHKKTGNIAIYINTFGRHSDNAEGMIDYWLVGLKNTKEAEEFLTNNL